MQVRVGHFPTTPQDFYNTVILGASVIIDPEASKGSSEDKKVKIPTIDISQFTPTAASMTYLKDQTAERAALFFLVCQLTKS